MFQIINILCSSLELLVLSVFGKYDELSETNNLIWKIYFISSCECCSPLYLGLSLPLSASPSLSLPSYSASTHPLSGLRIPILSVCLSAFAWFLQKNSTRISLWVAPRSQGVRILKQKREFWRGSESDRARWALTGLKTDALWSCQVAKKRNSEKQICERERKLKQLNEKWKQ